MEEGGSRRETDFQRALKAKRFSLNYKWWGGSPLAYFRNTENDGLRISWARGANKYEDLKAALRGPATIVQGDVIMSNGRTLNAPVMGRPGSHEFGMTLRYWLRRVRKNVGKGVMLHFHTANTLASAVKLVRRAAISGPKILSANIFRLDMNSPEPINPAEFAEAYRDRCPGAILCLGWTDDIRFLISNNMQYTQKSLNEITAFLDRHILSKTHVMLSMHATILARSISQVANLLNGVYNITLFVWTDEENPVRDVSDILAIRMSFAKDLVFYAIPDVQLNGLAWPRRTE